MNKAELAAAVAEQVNGTESEARAHIDALFDVIMRSVAAGERVQVVGFGTFDGAQRAARTGRNPRTGAAIQIAASVTPRFQAGQTFRAQVNGASPSSATPATVAATEVEAATPAPTAKKKADSGAKKVAGKKDAGKKDAAKKDAAKKDAAKKAKPASKKAKTAPEKKPAKTAPEKKPATKKSEAAKSAAKTTKAGKPTKSGKK